MMVLDIMMVDCWGRVAKQQHTFRLIVYHWEWDTNGMMDDIVGTLHNKEWGVVVGFSLWIVVVV